MEEIGNDYAIVPFFEYSRLFPGNESRENLDYLFYRTHRQDVFGTLFNQADQPLFATCTRLVLLKKVAEAAGSDVFYTVWKNRKRLGIITLRSFSYGTVKKRCLDYLRADKNILCLG